MIVSNSFIALYSDYSSLLFCQGGKCIWKCKGTRIIASVIKNTVPKKEKKSIYHKKNLK
jgi:hypothetical protein